MNTMEKLGIERSRAVYAALFEPDSIVIVGGSNDVLKPGGRVTKNIKDNGYSGELWAVNPKTPVVLDLPTYRTIDDLPHGPDLAIVAIPSPFVVGTLRALAARNTKAVIVLTSGFGEKNKKGKEIEYEMVRIANEAGMCLIGPNCSGFITKRYKGKFAGIIPRLPGKAVDFISGSGATVDYVMEYATTRGLSFGSVINLGNSAQMGVEDLLELYDENYGDRSASIVMLYLEAVKKPDKLLRHAASLAQKVVVLLELNPVLLRQEKGQQPVIPGQSPQAILQLKHFLIKPESFVLLTEQLLSMSPVFFRRPTVHYEVRECVLSLMQVVPESCFLMN